MIEKSLEKLSGEFKIKAKVLQEVFRTRHPNFAVYETLRSSARQVYLMAKRVTWTYNSYHLKGKAVDWVFMNAHGQPTWVGDYYLMQWIAAMCGMRRIKQELCHTEDNGVSISAQLKLNSDRRHNTHDIGEKYRLNKVNTAFRRHLGINQPQ